MKEIKRFIQVEGPATVEGVLYQGISGAFYLDGVPFFLTCANHADLEAMHQKLFEGREYEPEHCHITVTGSALKTKLEQSASDETQGD